jgi:hypothetical protein
LPRGFLDGDRERAGFDHDELRPPGRSELLRDLPQRLGRRQRANHHAGLTRDVAAIIRRLPARATERTTARLEHVVPDHAVLRAPEVRRHRGPHDAETDDADGAGGPDQRLKCKDNARRQSRSSVPRKSQCSPRAARGAIRRWSERPLEMTSGLDRGRKPGPPKTSGDDRVPWSLTVNSSNRCSSIEPEQNARGSNPAGRGVIRNQVVRRSPAERKGGAAGLHAVERRPFAVGPEAVCIP